MGERVLLGTRKGLFCLERDGERWRSKLLGFLGDPVTIATYDARNQTIWACLDHGHWGCKLSRSRDFGATWEEVDAPKYPQGAEIKPGVPATTKLLWAMTPGGADEPDVLYIGTEPGGLFKTADGGDSWHLVESLWNDPDRPEKWFGGGRDNAAIHSILVDPRDSQHLHIAVSCAGTYESHDGGDSWTVRNEGLRADFLPDPASAVGQDPHIVVAAPTNHDILWQQNHCGVYCSDDAGLSWTNVSNDIVNFGFAVAVSPHDAKRAWVIPGISDECRTAIDGALYVARTDDFGQTWTAHRTGLPQKDCYDIAFRHALDVHDRSLVFGTTTGNVFASNDEGESWFTVGNSFPPVYSVEFASW